jgi:hypothetical protein
MESKKQLVLTVGDRRVSTRDCVQAAHAKAEIRIDENAVAKYAGGGASLNEDVRVCARSTLRLRSRLLACARAIANSPGRCSARRGSA